MFREIAFGGVYVPVMTYVFFVAGAVAWSLGLLVSQRDAYKLFWHPALVRVSAFTCIFGAMSLVIYR
ncbi:hypothetical protein D3C71_273530 [compost metagenome]